MDDRTSARVEGAEGLARRALEEAREEVILIIRGYRASSENFQ